MDESPLLSRSQDEATSMLLQDMAPFSLFGRGGADERRLYAIEELRKFSIVHNKTTEHTNTERRFGDYT
jgi:hypothetical protein